MEYRILGPLEIAHGSKSVPLTAARERIVIAMLLLEAGRVIPIDRLIEGVWGYEPPATARAQIQNCISSLRRRLLAVSGRELIHTRPPGYVLEIEEGALDLHQFERRVAEGRALAVSGEASGAARRLRSALALWRGTVLADVDSKLIQLGVTRLSERLIAVLGECLESELAAGAHSELVGELAELVESYPLHEHFKALLMTALYRDGRQAEALEVYRRTREVLLEELGIEPGEELLRLHRAILTGDLDRVDRVSGAGLWPGRGVSRMRRGVTADADTAVAAVQGVGAEGGSDDAARLGRAEIGGRGGQDDLSTVSPDAAGSGGAEPVGDAVVNAASAQTRTPRLLPADIPDFTGRQDIVEQFLRGADAVGEPGNGRAVRVSVVAGQGGSGKTTLAVHVAHLLASRYPDGQLFAQLRCGGRPVGPSDILERFLRVLGVSGAGLPDTLEERAELFRDKTAGRRVLIVLDDAITEQQVAALLPGTVESAVIVTSRRRLTGLPATARYETGPLARHSALELLERVVGPRQIAAEPENADRLCELCGDLPLALRIVAARLAARPHWSLAEMVERLDDESRRLDELHHGGMQMRASITLTYEDLSEDARVLFRRLALLDSPDFASWAAAPLLEADVRRAEDALESLTEAYLVHTKRESAHGPVRYRLHDITRPFARQLLSDEGPQARRAALERQIAAMCALVGEACRRERRAAAPARADAEVPPHLPEALVDRLLADPLAWLEHERGAVIAAIRQCADLGMSRHCRDLALGMVPLFEAHLYVDDWRETHKVALEAARRVGDRPGQAALLYSLGTLASLQHRADAAAELLGEADELFVELGDRQGRARVQAARARIDFERGDVRGAVAGWRESLRALRDGDDRTAEAVALLGLAEAHLDLEEPDTAQDLVDRAVWICESSGDRGIGARVRIRAGELLGLGGRFDAALEACRDALAVCRERQDRVGECSAQLGLAQVARRRGDVEGAVRALANARALSVATGEALASGRVALALARVAVEAGDLGAGAKYAEQAIEQFGVLGTRLLLARALALRGCVHTAAQEPRAAAAMWSRARGVLGELGLESVVRLEGRAEADVTVLEGQPGRAA